MPASDLKVQVPVEAFFGRYYAASGTSCRRSRRDVCAALGDLGFSEDGAFAGEVVASELFGNALRHHSVQAAERVHVGVWTNPGVDGHKWVGVSVTDAGRGRVRTAEVAPLEIAEGGHGLEIVRGLGARVTDTRSPAGYTVTAWLPMTDQVRERVCQCDCASVHGAEPAACSWLIEIDGIRHASSGSRKSRLCAECVKLTSTRLKDAAGEAVCVAGVGAAKR